MLRKQFLETSRGRIAALLQRGGLTAEEMASGLGLTTNAIRAQLGAVTHIDRKNGGFVIRGAACPIAAITGKDPAACLMVEGFLQEIVGTPTRECCDRKGRPRCCFEFKPREAQK